MRVFNTSLNLEEEFLITKYFVARSRVATSRRLSAYHLRHDQNHNIPVASRENNSICVYHKRQAMNHRHSGLWPRGLKVLVCIYRMVVWSWMQVLRMSTPGNTRSKLRRLHILIQTLHLTGSLVVHNVRKVERP